MSSFFRSPRNYFLALAYTIVSFMTLLYFPSLAFIARLLVDPTQTASGIFRAIWIICTTSPFSIPATGLAQIFVVSVLVGINISLLIAYLKLQVRNRGLRAASLFGIIISLMGAGCAACGVTIFSWLAYVTGSVGLLAFFAQQSAFIEYAGIALLVLSSYTLVRALNARLVC